MASTGPEAILGRFSIEITARDRGALRAAADLLPPETEVFVADLPHQDPEILVETCARLRDSGLKPVPHLVARNIRSEAALKDLLARFAARSGADRALVLGGDRETPAGPYAKALDLIETGSLQSHGIRNLALACFPEGHPRIARADLEQALRAKLDAARRAGCAPLLVSQFAFDAQPVLDFVRHLRATGIETPLRVGVAGPADRQALRRFGRDLGAGESLKALEDGPPAAEGSEESPYDLVSALAAAQAEDPSLLIEGVHFFAFGSTARTIRWAEHPRPSP